MSKMDNLRAMREARYAEGQKRAAGAGGAAARTAAKKAAPVRPAPVATDPADLEAFGSDSSASADALCGHRNMGGRSCTREKGHTAKSHRYS